MTTGSVEVSRDRTLIPRASSVERSLYTGTLTAIRR